MMRSAAKLPRLTVLGVHTTKTNRCTAAGVGRAASAALNVAKGRIRQLWLVLERLGGDQ